MKSITNLNIVDEMLLKKMSGGGGEREVEEDLLFFSMYEQQQSGGDLFLYQNMYVPNDNTDALLTDNGWSGNNYGKTLTFTALKSKKIRLKGKYQFNKWQAGYNCYVEIKHNNVSLSRYDSTIKETKSFDVDVEVDLQVGDTLTFHRDQVFFTWNGVFSIISLA